MITSIFRRHKKSCPYKSAGRGEDRLLPLSVLGGRKPAGDEAPALDGGNEQERSHENCPLVGKR